MSWKRTKCIIETCRVSLNDFPDRRFFRFPKPGNKNYKIWLESIGPSAKIVKERKVPYICSIHFQKEDFGKKFLKRDAVPRLFLGNPNHESALAVNNGRQDLKSVKTYVKAKKSFGNDDITLEELDTFSKNIPYRNIEQEKEDENIVCSNCVKKSKNELFYIRKIIKLEDKVRKLQNNQNSLCKKNRTLKTKLCRYQNLYKTERNKTLNEQIDSLTEISPHAKTFSKLILGGKKVCYTNEEKWLSQCIFFRSAAGYTFLKENLEFHLPSISSLNKWVKIKSLSPGPDSSVFKELNIQVGKLSEHEKDVILLFDEMYIQQNLTFNKFKDKIDGFVDHGDGKRQNVIAKSVCVFMVRSLFGRFKQVLYYVACSGSISAEALNSEIKKCIEITNKIGLKVRAIGCDQGPINRKLFNFYNISHEKTYFSHEDTIIHALFDVPHLFKSIRNNLMATNLLTPDGRVSWEIIVTLYNVDQSETTRICPKLTFSHISPNDFHKMNVRLAVQVLSRSVAIGIRVLLSYGKYPEELQETALSTAKFIEKMNKLFDILNGKPAIKRDSCELHFLEEMKKYILQIKIDAKYDRSFCFKGLALTIATVINLSNSMFSIHKDIYYFHLQKLNQDPLENFFSHIRSRNSNKQNPSLFEFSSLFAKIMSIKLLFTSKFSNCDNDEDEILDIDWNTICDGHVSKENSTTVLHSISEEVMEESEFENEEKLNVSDAATTYFAGYCYLKTVKSLGKICDQCKTEMTSKLLEEDENISKILIKLKQYENLPPDSGLITPSEKFFNICKDHVQIFSRIYLSAPHILNLRKTIVEHCIEHTRKIYPDWFHENNKCFDHHIKAVEFFILVLLRKHCKWSTDAANVSKRKLNKKIQKIINITNM